MNFFQYEGALLKHTNVEVGQESPNFLPYASLFPVWLIFLWDVITIRLTKIMMFRNHVNVYKVPVDLLITHLKHVDGIDTEKSLQWLVTIYIPSITRILQILLPYVGPKLLDKPEKT